MLKHRKNVRLFAALCALSLSACGPSPTSTVPTPTSSPLTSPDSQASPVPTAPPSGTPGATTSDLTVHLQADASLAGFATQQTGPFNLCLSRIARASTTVRLSTALDAAAQAALQAAGATVTSDNGRSSLTVSRDLT